MAHRLAVLGEDTEKIYSDYLLSYSEAGNRVTHNTITSTTPYSIVDLVELAYRTDMDTLWIAPKTSTSHLAAEFPARFKAIPPGNRLEMAIPPAATARQAEKPPTCVHAWRTQGTTHDRRTIRIFFPEHDSRWGLEHFRDFDLLEAVTSAEKALGVRLDYSPGHTGIDLLRELNSNAWWQPCDLTALGIASGNAHAVAIKFKAPPPAIFGIGYFHTYDKRSMHLGAACNINIGEGSPEFLPFATTEILKEHMPGVWEIILDNVPVPLEQTFKIGHQWIWTPELWTLHKMGATFAMGDAYVWKKYHPALRAWAEHLWIARQVAGAGAPIIKKIYTQALGWLGHMPNNGIPGPFTRKDAQNMVVSRAAALMRFKIAELASGGYTVVWCNADEIGLLSYEADPRKACAPLVARENELGGFTPRYSLSYHPDSALARLLLPSTPHSQAAADLLRMSRLQASTPVSEEGEGIEEWEPIL
jgi:hypothetical protein